MKSLRSTIIPGAGCAVLLALCSAGRAAEQPVLSDDFSDGNFTAAPVWSARKGTWQVKDGALATMGDAEFSAIATSDFKTIEDGSFRLSFDVKFRDAESSGRNRIIVALRDKSGKGYQVEISQGTANNTILSRLDPASNSLTNTLLSPAYKFPLDALTRVTFSRTRDGVLSVTVNGQDYLKATDTMYQQFSSVQLNSRSPSATLVQEFDNIRLETGETLASTAAARPRNAFYQPAKYRWFLQEVDFSVRHTKPSTAFGAVVAKGTEVPQIDGSVWFKNADWSRARFQVQRGFQGAAVASWEQTKGAATPFPVVPRGAYWVTAKSFDSRNHLGERKVFF